MKKFLAILLAAVLVISLSGCGIPFTAKKIIDDSKIYSERDIEKAILTSDIGINPQNDGKVIRLNFPPLTEERRKDIVKDVRKKGEDAKVAVRNQRRDALDKLKALKKDNKVTEDDVTNGEKKIQNLTDKACKEIDNLADIKEKEIMEI